MNTNVYVLLDWFHLGLDSRNILYPKTCSFPKVYNCTVGFFLKETMLCMNLNVGDFANMAQRSLSLYLAFGQLLCL